MRTLLRGGRVVDPGQRIDALRDLLIEDGRIEALLDPGAEVSADEVVDLSGLVVAPGFIDLGARLGEPGFEHRETIASGLAAAAAGGYTTVACSPHTDPVLDSPSVVEHVLAEANRVVQARLVPLAAATRGLAGEQLAEYVLLARAGAVGLSNGQRPIVDGGVLRRALLHAQHVDLVLMHRAEDAGLAGRGVMHEGEVSALLGLAGIPSSAEAAMLARDLMVVEETGGRYHATAVSAARSLVLLRQARQAHSGISVDVGINHLVLCDEDVRDSTFSPATKIQPPLRARSDREALIEALAAGEIDAIISHHVPLHNDEKLESFDRAPYGAVGLETTVGLALTELVRPGRISLLRLVEVLSAAPARVLGLPDRGSLARGQRADLTLLDLDIEWTVSAKQMFGRSRNSPYLGRTLTGRAVATYLDGRRVAPVARRG